MMDLLYIIGVYGFFISLEPNRKNRLQLLASFDANLQAARSVWTLIMFIELLVLLQLKRVFKVKLMGKRHQHDDRFGSNRA